MPFALKKLQAEVQIDSLRWINRCCVRNRKDAGDCFKKERAIRSPRGDWKCCKALILLDFCEMHLWCIFWKILLFLSWQQEVFCSDCTYDASINPVAYEDGEAVFIDTEYVHKDIDAGKTVTIFNSIDIYSGLINHLSKWYVHDDSPDRIDFMDAGRSTWMYTWFQGKQRLFRSDFSTHDVFGIGRERG